MAANSEKLIKKAIKLISESTEIEYEELKIVCKKVLRAAKNYDQQMLGTMEELLDLGDISSEEELADFDIEVLKIYCKIKDIDPSGSDKAIRTRVWEHFEEELEMESDSDDSEEEESDEEPEPVVIKKKKEKKVLVEIINTE